MVSTSTFALYLDHGRIKNKIKGSIRNSKFNWQNHPQAWVYLDHGKKNVYITKISPNRNVTG
jgi:hypothetical protein